MLPHPKGSQPSDDLSFLTHLYYESYVKLNGMYLEYQAPGDFFLDYQLDVMSPLISRESALLLENI